MRYIETLIKEYRLELHFPDIIQELGMIDPKNPKPIHQKILTDIEERLAPIMQYHANINPFVVAPASIFQGDIILGRQQGNNALLKVSTLSIAQNAIAIGPTGQGKTSLVSHVAAQLIQKIKGTKLLITDFKKDFRWIGNHPDTLVIHPEAKFNLMQKPAWLSFDMYLLTLVGTFAKSTWGGEHLRQIMFSALKTVFAENDNPCFEDLRRVVNRMYKRADTFAYKDAIRGVSLRLDRIKCLYPGLFLTH